MRLKNIPIDDRHAIFKEVFKNIYKYVIERNYISWSKNRFF